MSFTTKLVDSGDVRLATRDYGGTGPALVLMHGAGAHQGSLEQLVHELQPTYRVITFDFRGHGHSQTATWDFASAVTDVGAVAEAYRLDVPAVAGHSLGGMVAAAYALEHPTCPGAINIDGHGLGRVEQYVGVDEADVRAWWASHQRMLDRLTRGPLAVVLRVLAFVLREKPAASAETSRQVQAAVESPDLFAIYRQLACPLLVFNATANEDRAAMRLLVGKGLPLLRAYRAGLTRDFAALACERDLVEIVEIDATHMLITTHAPEVALRIDAFLRRSSRSRI